MFTRLLTFPLYKTNCRQLSSHYLFTDYPLSMTQIAGPKRQKCVRLKLSNAPLTLFPSHPHTHTNTHQPSPLPPSKSVFHKKLTLAARPARHRDFKLAHRDLCVWHPEWKIDCLTLFLPRRFEG